MSLKAKIEAIIYATEEPVTLNELASLLKDAALADMRTADEARLALNETVSDGPTPAEIEEDEDFGIEEAAAEIAGMPELAVAIPSESEQPAPEPTKDEKQAEEKEQLKAAKAHISQLINELVADYASANRGMEIRQIAGGYRMATKPECHDAVRLFVRSLKPPLKLSLPALETLAVVAYKQPVTAPEVSEIRGVESAGTLGSLLSRKLIATAGRKPVIGRPILYKTTREFLLRFGLKDVAELPSMEEFEKMAAIELDEQAPAEDGEVRVELRVEDTAEFEFDDSVEREDDELAGEAQKPVELQQGEFASADALQPAETEASPHER